MLSRAQETRTGHSQGIKGGVEVGKLRAQGEIAP